MEAEEVSNSNKLHLFAISTSSKPKPLTCEVIVKGNPLVMENNTGAEVSVISSEGTRQAIFPGMQPTKSSVLLKTYTNEVISVGELQVKVQ